MHAGGGFKGTIVKAGLAPLSCSAGMLPLQSAASAPATTAATAECTPLGTTPTDQSESSGAPEPNLHEAQVKASSLFRPGSPIAISNGSSRQGVKTGGVAATVGRARSPLGHSALIAPVDHAAGEYYPLPEVAAWVDQTTTIHSPHMSEQHMKKCSMLDQWLHSACFENGRDHCCTTSHVVGLPQH